MLRKIGFTLVALILGSPFVSAQTTLKLKFPEGSKFVTQTESKSKQTLSLRINDVEMDIDTSSSIFMTSTKSIGKREANALKVTEKVDSVQAEISLPGGVKIEFDSANPNKPASNPMLEPVLDVFRSLAELPVIVELDAKDKISSVKLPEGEYEKLSEAAKERFAPETLKKAAEEAMEFLPDGPVKKGDTWERSSEVNAGGGQVISFRTKFEYAGTTEKEGKTLDKITGKAFEVSYTVNNPQFQVTKSDLKIIESESTYLFNREQGAIISRTSKVRIGGTLTLVAGGLEIPGKVDLTIEENVSRQK